MAGGVFRVGDEVAVLPGGFTSRIKEIDGPNGPVEEAFAPMSITMTLEDDIDVSRGNMIVRANNQPLVTQDLEAMLCWLHNKPARPRAKYTLMHTSNEQKAMIKEVVHKVDIQTLSRVTDDDELQMNDICKVKIRTTQPIMVDPYRDNRSTGSFVLIDDATNETVAAGMVF